MKINRITLELFTSLKKAREEKGYGSLFDRLTGIKETFFQGKDVSQDEVLIVRNDTSADFARFEYRFRDVMQFISGPTLPHKAKPSKRMAAAVAFVLGIFAFTLLSFFLEFIQRSKDREVKASGKKGKK